VPRDGGREKVSVSVQSTASEVLAFLNWPGIRAPDIERDAGVVVTG
jgi:hypothetical protein